MCLSGEKKATLQAMKLEWDFVTDLVDSLPEKHSLRKLMNITQSQPYRDIMTKAECLFCWFLALSVKKQMYIP